MRFNKFGQSYQLGIQSSQDVLDVLALDESLWVASSAPVASFRMDMRFLNFVDYDQNGRINTIEVKDSIHWLQSTFDDMRKVAWEQDHLLLSAISKATDSGQHVLASAEYILRTLGTTETGKISLGQVRQFLSGIRQQALNGDGTVIPAATDDEPTRAFIRDIITCMGGQEDAGGKAGVSRGSLKAFTHSIDAFLTWRDSGTGSPLDESESFLPLGEKTAAAYKLLHPYIDRIDHYFEVVRAVHFKPELRSSLETKTGLTQGPEYAQSNPLKDWLAQFPIARLLDDEHLPLEAHEINPIYRDDIQTLRNLVFSPILGHQASVLSFAEWLQVKAAFKLYGEYLALTRGVRIASLPLETLRRYSKGDLAANVTALIEADEKVSETVKGAQNIEKTILYQKFLVRLLNNFVSFGELYNVDQRALFESGSLLIDGRWFNLVLRVENVETHSEMAKSSNIFTFYLEISKAPDKIEYLIAVPATSGTKGNLRVGKRGVFFDLNGKEFDARIIKVIENPISLTEALCLPFSRLWAFILGKIEAISSSSEQQLQKATDGILKESPIAGPPPAEAKSPGMAHGNLLMGLSVSVAALGSAFAFISSSLSEMSAAQRITSFLAAAAFVIVPVSLVAILKLRAQDLSSLLEGCAWGVNTRMRFTNALRRQFTRKAPYPAHAEGTPRNRGLLYLLVGLIALVALRLLLT